MNHPTPLEYIFEYGTLFFMRGIPSIIAVVSLILLFIRTKDGDHFTTSAMPYVVVIVACSAILAYYWAGLLSLAAVAIAMVVMSKLKVG